MAKVILDGKKTSGKIKTRLKDLIWTSQISPKLCIIQGGDRPDSNQYVKNKIRACNEVGIDVELKKIPVDENYIDNLKEAVIEANNNADAIIVQLPIPGVSSDMQRNIVELIDKDKDVDCLRFESEGAFYATQNRQLAPCTPMGIITLLKEYGFELSNKKVCIIGRSKIVGRPLMELMLNENATVTICHSKTEKKDLYDIVAMSDVVISAAGIPDLLNIEDMEKYIPSFDKRSLCDTVAIDVGTNYVDGRWCGDISSEFKEACYAYSPVPGGVGPMTIVSLLQKIVSKALVNNFS